MGAFSLEFLNSAIGSAGGTGNIRRRNMAGEYQKAVKIIVDVDLVKPSEGRHILIQPIQFETNQLPQDFPSDKGVRTKLSSLKSAMKRR